MTVGTLAISVARSAFCALLRPLITRSLSSSRSLPLPMLLVDTIAAIRLIFSSNRNACTTCYVLVALYSADPLPLPTTHTQHAPWAFRTSSTPPSRFSSTINPRETNGSMAVASRSFIFCHGFFCIFFIAEYFLYIAHSRTNNFSSQNENSSTCQYRRASHDGYHWQCRL